MRGVARLNRTKKPPWTGSMGIAKGPLSGLQPLARKYKCRLGAAHKQPTLHDGNGNGNGEARPAFSPNGRTGWRLRQALFGV